MRFSGKGASGKRYNGKSKNDGFKIIVNLQGLCQINVQDSVIIDPNIK